MNLSGIFFSLISSGFIFSILQEKENYINAFVSFGVLFISHKLLSQWYIFELCTGDWKKRVAIIGWLVVVEAITCFNETPPYCSQLA